MNIKRLFLFLIYSLNSPLPLLKKKKKIVFTIHQNVHLVLFSKYIQSLTLLTTSTSQEVFSWKLTLGWSQVEAR